jgi:hypothetical protein
MSFLFPSVVSLFFFFTHATAHLLHSILICILLSDQIKFGRVELYSSCFDGDPQELDVSVFQSGQGALARSHERGKGSDGSYSHPLERPFTFR